MDGLPSLLYAKMVCTRPFIDVSQAVTAATEQTGFKAEKRGEACMYNNSFPQFCL